MSKKGTHAAKSSSLWIDSGAKNLAFAHDSWSDRHVMNMLRVLNVVLLGLCCVAADPTWNPADAVKEAEQDIRSGHIKFYWAGSIASRPVGVPIEVAKNYPKANAGIGCVTNDIPLRERQEEYARRYNEKIYAYISQKH
jgi:hypothetical protein